MATDYSHAPEVGPPSPPFTRINSSLASSGRRRQAGDALHPPLAGPARYIDVIADVIS